MRSTDFCPECARPTDDADVHRDSAACPHCGSPLLREEATRWINVARVTNLAEAGFLVDELAGDGIDARIYQIGRFQRADGSLAGELPDSVAAARCPGGRGANPAASGGDGIVSGPGRRARWPDERPALDPLVWRPVALVMLAGMASFVLGQRFAADRDSPRPQRNSLATAMAAIGRPLVTEPAAGAAASSTLLPPARAGLVPRHRRRRRRPVRNTAAVPGDRGRVVESLLTGSYRINRMRDVSVMFGNLILSILLILSELFEESSLALTWRQHRPRGHGPRGPQDERAGPGVGGDARRAGRRRRDYGPLARGSPAHSGARFARADRIGGRADQSGVGVCGRCAGNRLRRWALSGDAGARSGARKSRPKAGSTWSVAGSAWRTP